MIGDEVDIGALAVELTELRASLVQVAQDQAAAVDAVHPRHRASAVNLVQYVALRRVDVRDLQVRLALLGLSSLGRMESHVLAGIDRVLGAVTAVGHLPPPEPVPVPVGIEEGRALLEENATALFGPAPPGRSTRILVTMPSTAADDPDLVAEMVDAGMDLARVNCAHDEPASWRRMLDHVRAAASAAGSEVRVAMDLAGPKLRTGPLEPGPQVVKVKPLRDATGKVLAPGVVLLSSCGASVPGATTVPVHDDAWLRRRRPGQEVRLRDTRGARRRLTIRSVTGDGCLAELTKTTYFGSGTRLVVGGHHDHDVATVGELPEAAQALRLRPGDELVLTEDLQPQPVAPPAPGPGRARIGCTLPELFESVEPGHRVFLDDGKIGGEVVERREGEVVVRITDAAPEGTRLRAEKGINVPDTHLAVPALTDKDVEDLEFVAANAEIVNLSFVRDAADVALLQQHLARLGGQHIGIVLKIETVEAFENLPDLLLEALRWDLVGVMIARGDLAVEAGYERLAEVQEEILWLCEAGHVPVIWATQVLDTLAKTGRPSRAEVSDAAMAERAECVMLNKGPYIVSAIATLSDILGRMTGHQAKKSALLRELRAWTRHLT